MPKAIFHIKQLPEESLEIIKIYRNIRCPALLKKIVF